MSRMTTIARAAIARRKSPAEARMSLAVLAGPPGVARCWMTPKLAAAASTARTTSPAPATTAGRRIARVAARGGPAAAAAVLMGEGAGCVVVMALGLVPCDGPAGPGGRRRLLPRPALSCKVTLRHKVSVQCKSVNRRGRAAPVTSGTDPGRTARAPLSRERVLREAVALADESGIAALTMRRLADRLQVEPMSLYY